MRNEGQALAFSARVDEMMAGLGSEDKDGDLKAAQLLAQLDMSVRSRVRENLRVSATTPRPDAILFCRMASRRLRRPLPTALGALTLVLVLVQCTWPGGIKGLIVQIGGTVTYGTVTLGKGTTYSVLDMSEPRPNIRDEGTVTTLWGRESRQGLPRVISPTVKQFSSYAAAARTVTSFVPRLPRHLPRGWRVKLVLVPPFADELVTFFTNGWRTIEFDQRRVLELGRPDGSTFYAGGGLATSKSNGIEDRMITFDGVEAVWRSVTVAPGDVDTTLVWERNFVSYVLAAETLSLEETLKIARSVD